MQNVADVDIMRQPALGAVMSNGSGNFERGERMVLLIVPDCTVPQFDAMRRQLRHSSPIPPRVEGLIRQAASIGRPERLRRIGQSERGTWDAGRVWEH